MPPPLSHPSLHLSVLEKDFFVIKKDTLNGDILDALKSAPGFFSVTRTAEEISIVGEAYTDMPQSFQENCTWVCIKIAGPMEHSESKVGDAGLGSTEKYSRFDRNPG